MRPTRVVVDIAPLRGLAFDVVLAELRHERDRLSNQIKYHERKLRDAQELESLRVALAAEYGPAICEKMTGN